jgi:hypothetical protein
MMGTSITKRIERKIFVFVFLRKLTSIFTKTSCKSMQKDMKIANEFANIFAKILTKDFVINNKY